MFERFDGVRRMGTRGAGVLLGALCAGLPALAAAQTGGEGGRSNPLFQMIPLALVIVIFYFLILRPQQQRQKAVQKMIQGLRKGDRVLTGGGIYGTVFAIKDDTIVLEIGRDVRVECARSAITAVVPAE